jgi:FG-GAP-like repeat
MNSWSGDATFADLKGAAYPSLYFLNMQGNNHFFENEGGKKFVDKTTQCFPRTPWGAMGVKFFEFDNDGLMDLLVTDMHSDMSQEVGPEREKLKSDMRYPGAFLQGGMPQDKYVAGRASSETLSITIWGTESSRRSRIIWDSRRTGPGASASET